MKNCLKIALTLICALSAVACSSSKNEPAAAPVAATSSALEESQPAAEANEYQTVLDYIYRADYREAITLATQLMDRDGKSLDALTMRGIAYAKLGEPYPAYADLLEATQMERSVDTLLNLGNALRMNGLCDRAIDAYKQALSLSPDNPEVIINMTNAYICLDDPDNANALIQSTLANFSPDAIWYTNAAIIKNIQQQYDEARKAAELAISIDPNYRPAYQALYQICVNQKDAACKQEAQKQHNILRGQVFRSKTKKRVIK